MMIQTLNPATKEILHEYEIHNKEKALQITRSANLASKSWKETSFTERKTLFTQLAKELRSNKQEYAEMMTKEMGKVMKESLAEIEKCAWLADMLAEKGEGWLKEETVDAGGETHLITFEPLGTIYLIMPWNYPFWQPMKVGLLPLFAGNTILLKHAKNVTGSALLIEDTFRKAGFPKDVFRAVIIDHDTSDQIIASEYIQAVSFTGSVGAGSHVANISAKHIKKTVLELGGSDPFVVLNDANIQEAAKAVVKGRMSNCGQVCIGAKRIIVHKDVADEFINEFKNQASKLKIGDPMDLLTDIGPLVDAKSFKDMELYVKDAEEKDAEIVLGGDGNQDEGYYFRPTIVIQGKEILNMSSEEVFGPIVPIIIVETEEEAIDEANNTIFGLNASIWTTNLDKGKMLARKIESGGVFINHISESHPLLPLGGIKKSGYGRELSHIGIKEFVNIKPINIYR